MKVREPYFASQGWYPASQKECLRAVKDYLSAAPPEEGGRSAGVVPHAGWYFSGAVAARAYSALAGQKPDVVFVFGGHLPPQDSCICMTQGAFGTPLGPIPVETELAAEAAGKFRCQVETPERFRPDNTIELQLPFVRHLWPAARVVAMQVPPTAMADEVGAWAAGAAAARGLEALCLGSTDLTHYGAAYGFMPQGTGDQAHRWSKEQNDRPFLDRLAELDGRGAVAHALSHHSACCPGAAAAATAFARGRGAKSGRLLLHTTSAEIEGRPQPSMWVGYAALVF